MEINEIIYQIVCSAWTLCGDLLCGQIVSSSVLHFLQYLGFFGDFQWFFGTFQDNLELFTRIHSSVLTFFFNAAPAESLGNSCSTIWRHRLFKLRQMFFWWFRYIWRQWIFLPYYLEKSWGSRSISTPQDTVWLRPRRDISSLSH